MGGIVRVGSCLGAMIALGGCGLLAGIDDWAPGASNAASSVGSSATVGGGGAAGHAAEGGGGMAVNATCADGIQNGPETDIDCGGDACGPCALGLTCQNDADCADLACDDGICAVAPDPPPCPEVDPTNPHCADCTQNGLETDVDCGGDSCGPCALTQHCQVDADCSSERCAKGKCVFPPVDGCSAVDPDNPSCGDCAKNGSETDVDCGGDACPPCALGEDCLLPVDCTDLGCVANKCVVANPGCTELDPDNPTCADCVMNGQESDVDCGGDACGPCDAGEACLTDFDCESRLCKSGSCG